MRLTRWTGAGAAGAAVLAAALVAAAPARAAGDGRDGLYGRFDGDLELRVAAGAALAQGGPALAAQVTALYLGSAGVYAHYTDALGGEGPRTLRSLATGLHLQPVFLARYASNAEHGPAHLDLLLDSLALELGPFWAEPRGGPWTATPGLELALGLGLPILGRATGPFLGVRGALRWRPGDFTAGGGGGDPVERGAVLSLTLGWHQVVRSGLVDPGDGLVEMSAALADLRGTLAASLQAALAALDPARLVREALPPLPPRRARVLVVAAGKAAAAMAAGAFARWPDRIEEALVITATPLPDPAAIDPRGRVEVRSAAHPIPDERSVAAADEALRRAASLGAGDLLLALISGGASALLAAPPEGMTLEEKQSLVASLLERGMPIRDVNLVRRHLSRIKGGRLARAAAPARTLTLIVGDVIGGAPHDVGSGPTVPDPTTVAEARAALKRAGLAAPAALEESLKPEEAVRARAKIVADPAALGRAVAAELSRRGLHAVVDEPDEGDVRAVLDRRLARARTLEPGEAVVIPCEPTITLPQMRGRGGRAGWIALAAMRGLPEDVVLLCAASDGVDGSSQAGGAVVAREDALRIDAATIDAALAGFDDAAVHRALGTHVPGLATGHNLADVHVLARLR